MQKLELIGRGKSRQEVKNDRIHWYISTACREIKILSINDVVWNLHDEHLWESWFSTWRHKATKHNVNMSYYVAKHGRVFASTASWMLAAAHELGYDDVLINGIDLNNGQYEKSQRDSLFYLVGYFRALGMTINHVIPQFFETGLYQFE